MAKVCSGDDFVTGFAKANVKNKKRFGEDARLAFKRQIDDLKRSKKNDDSFPYVFDGEKAKEKQSCLPTTAASEKSTSSVRIVEDLIDSHTSTSENRLTRRKSWPFFQNALPSRATNLPLSNLQDLGHVKTNKRMQMGQSSAQMQIKHFKHPGPTSEKAAFNYNAFSGKWAPFKCGPF